MTTNFTIFEGGSVGATIASQQALRMANLDVFIHSLKHAMSQLSMMAQLAPEICKAIEDRAEEQYEASKMQAAGAIAAGAVGVVGGLTSFGLQAHYNNQMNTKYAELNKVGEGSTTVGLSRDAASINSPQLGKTPAEIARRKELKQELKVLEGKAQNIPMLAQNLTKACEGLITGITKLEAAGNEQKAAKKESLQKWLDSVQQQIARFMEALNAQKQAALDSMQAAQRAHEEIIRAAASRG